MGKYLIFEFFPILQESRVLPLFDNISRMILFAIHLDYSFNPKRPGLFGLPDTRGGVESTHFGKRSLTTPHFHSRPANSISYESWHILLKFDTLLRLLRLKLRPREAAEVAKVQAKKIRSKILKSAIFELQKRYIPQKKAENNCHSDLK